jgi:hypothetical protein
VCCALSLAEEYIKHRQRRNQAYPNSTAVVVDTDVQKAGTLGTTSTPYGASSAITTDDAPPPLVHPKLLTSVRCPIVSTMTVCCALSLADEYIKHKQRRDEDAAPTIVTKGAPYGASSAITIDDAPPPLVHPKLLTSVRRPIVSTMTVCCALSLAEEYIKYRQRRDEDDSPSTSAALHTDVQKAAADTLSTTSNLYGESSRPLRSPLKNTPVSHQLRRFTQRVSCNLSRRGIHEDQTAQ